MPDDADQVPPGPWVWGEDTFETYDEMMQGICNFLADAVPDHYVTDGNGVRRLIEMTAQVKLDGT